MLQIIAYLDSIYPMSPGLKDYLWSVVQVNTLRKGQLLLQAGQYCRYLYFIEKGLIRSYYLKGGDEVCNWFMKEGDFVTSIPSYYDQKPSTEYIQTLEDCVLYHFSYQDERRAYRDYMEFNFISRQLIEHYYVLSEERQYALRRLSVEEKFDYTRAHWPWMLERVPDKHLATFLGMWPETFSRMRRRRFPD